MKVLNGQEKTAAEANEPQNCSQSQADDQQSLPA